MGATSQPPSVPALVLYTEHVAESEHEDKDTGEVSVEPAFDREVLLLPGERAGTWITVAAFAPGTAAEDLVVLRAEVEGALPPEPASWLVTVHAQAVDGRSPVDTLT